MSPQGTHSASSLFRERAGAGSIDYASKGSGVTLWRYTWIGSPPVMSLRESIATSLVAVRRYTPHDRAKSLAPVKRDGWEIARWIMAFETKWRLFARPARVLAGRPPSRWRGRAHV